MLELHFLLTGKNLDKVKGANRLSWKEEILSMQNEDEELRGLEAKLSRLMPKDLDEPYLGQLVGALDNKEFVVQDAQQGHVYPPNVLWMRFAPIAAAAGVVLLGSFFIHYQSRMDGLQAQSGAASADQATELKSSAMNAERQAEVVADAPSAPSAPSQWAALPVPRLGVGESYSPLNSFDPSLLPVSGQNYLQPFDGALGIKTTAPANTALHFSDAYDWQDSKKTAATK